MLFIVNIFENSIFYFNALMVLWSCETRSKNRTNYKIQTLFTVLRL